MLKIKLFRGFAVLVILFSVLSAFVGIGTIRRSVVGEAQNRVRLDLSSAWAVYNSKLSEVETILELVASKQIVSDVCEAEDWSNADLRNRIERIRVKFGLDFLSLVGPDGKVMVRTRPPYAEGDYCASGAAVSRALKGETVSCMDVLTRAELAQEGDGLADQAFLELEDTPRARRTGRREESRGMAMVGVVPVQKGLRVLGAVYGGILINRNHKLIDEIHSVVYKNEKYKDRMLGTATIFLSDSRIATTVRGQNGNRALGTRVSKEVADQVLDNGRPWIGEAFVVRDWYLSAYDPIRDAADQIIGMLYVGILREPFDAAGRSIVFRYLFLSLFVLLVGLALAFYMAGRLTQPIHRLSEASLRLRGGERPEPVPTTDHACHETETLTAAFNQMAAALVDREEKLKGLNRSYMETLGFVSHELKSPVATIMNYVYLLKERKLGPLTDKQVKAVGAIHSGSQRLVEMVRHYLNLSRIENGELDPVKTQVKVLDDVVAPLLEAAEADVEVRKMTVTNRIGGDIALLADLNMVREVFENLIGNAVKYGRDGGAVELTASVRDGMVEFSVRNEGEGIREDRIGEMFKKFSRIEDSSAARKQKGTGLGLFITKHIVDAHGGTISVASKAGEWAEFVFTLPQYKEEGGTGT